MKLSLHCVVVLVIVFSMAAVSQAQPPADPYKPVLDRLQAITTMPLDSWQIIAADLPHGETPGASMADAKPMALKQSLQLPVWLYQSVEIPLALNGYSVAGSRVSLNLDIGGNTGILISVFVNGNMVARGDQDSQVPITLDAERPARAKAFDRRPSAAIGNGRLLRRAARNQARRCFAGVRSAGKSSRPRSLAPGNHGGRTAHRCLSRRQSSNASSSWMRR